MRQAQACLRVKAVSAADDNLIPNKAAPSTTSNSAKYIQKKCCLETTNLFYRFAFTATRLLSGEEGIQTAGGVGPKSKQVLLAALHLRVLYST